VQYTHKIVECGKINILVLSSSPKITDGQEKGKGDKEKKRRLSGNIIVLKHRAITPILRAVKLNQRRYRTGFDFRRQEMIVL
jgi:hypothetical protein